MPEHLKDRATEEIVTHYTETYDESQRLTVQDAGPVVGDNLRDSIRNEG